MKSAPTGKVTFLFTDIEGSVKLAQKHPDIIKELLDKHHDIINQSVIENNGFVFKIIGDAFCSSFENPDDALNASVSAQRKFNSEDWKDAEMKVRMGIHTGPAEWSESGYMGYITLARSHRVMSAANGGQILISEDSKKGIKEDLTGKISFRDLGERRLKDLIRPIKLFQPVADGIISEFPPLKTLDARPNNLPVQLTSFIGRDNEITTVKKLLSESRLLTLTGSGGSGKTRLALQAGAELIDKYINGVWFIDLASLQDGNLLYLKIAESIGLNEQQGKSIEENLYDYIKDKEILIILDNCEHLINECANLSMKFLHNSSKMKILTTSREALKCQGEILHNVLPLKFPDPKDNSTPDKLVQFEAVRLFIERALSVSPNFRVNNENASALAGICFQLDGIPLAIELAAARVKILPLEKIYEKLSDRFRLLTGGSRTMLPRQQTLSAMIDWSYDLLNDKEKILFERLSVFTGGWTLEAAEKICSDEMIEDFEVIDILSGLIDKSLVISKESEREIRFSMLVTIRQYALNKINEGDHIFSKHFSYFRELGNYAKQLSAGLKQKEYIDIAESEIDNIRAAINWGTEHETEETFRFINDLTEFWRIRGYYSEGYQTCINLLEKKPEVSGIPRANVIYSQALNAYGIGKLKEMEELANSCLSIYEEANYRYGIANCYELLGIIWNASSADLKKTSDYHYNSLEIFRELGEKSDIANSLYNLSFILHRQGDLDSAIKMKFEALDIFKVTGDTHRVALVLANLGVIYFRKEEYKKAQSYTEESLALSYQIGDKYMISVNLVNYGCISTGLKDYEKALEYLEKAMEIFNECGYIINVIPALLYTGEVYNYTGEFEKAISNYKESISKGSEAGIEYFLPNNIFGMAEVLFKLKKYGMSLKFFQILKILDEVYDKKLGGKKNTSAEKYMKQLAEIIGEDNKRKDTAINAGLSVSEIIKIALSEETV
ncbi:MAG: tetratricopeptide repeat protein [Ignavibacteria bacterium]|nr:tetratricopeptide repeat protein [Ignavibacteria bacterium]